MKANWIRKKIYHEEIEVSSLLNNLKVNTVCTSAYCPNRWECYKNKVATFMILGDKCTRQCKFCAVKKAKPSCINKGEIENIIKAIINLRLDYVVITSVTRDDLVDGGASQFVKIIESIKREKKKVEVLIPDFDGNIEAIDDVIDAKPQVINHNIETVPSLYEHIRPKASFERSLAILERVKQRKKRILTKTGIMLGLGESKEELIKVFEKVVEKNIDILTLGQYLQATKEHYPVKKYYSQEEFDELAKIAYEMGVKWVEAGPFVRSSYNAKNIYEQLINNTYNYWDNI